MHPKVYGNEEGRAMRHGGMRHRAVLPHSWPSKQPSLLRRALTAGARVLVLLVCIQVAGLPLLSGSARADEMMLMNDSGWEKSGYGWLFLGLTLVAFGVAANDYQESQYNLKKAKDAYSSYQASTTAADALLYRELTTTYSHRAQAYESTTNAALLIGVVLAATTIAVFRYDGKSDTPILIGDRTVGWQYKF